MAPINRGAISVTTAGPIFEGRAQAEIEAVTTAVLDDVSVMGVGVVRDTSKGSFRHPRPYYWTRIDADGSGALQRRITDQGVIYGPWLEGISSRNRTTRFKGYAMWRRSVGEIQKRVARITKAAAERIAGALS